MGVILISQLIIKSVNFQIYRFTKEWLNTQYNTRLYFVIQNKEF